MAVSLIPQEHSVTKWASCEHHLDTTYLKLAQVPWQRAWRREAGDKLHHLLNMHVPMLLRLNHLEGAWFLRADKAAIDMLTTSNHIYHTKLCDQPSAHLHQTGLAVHYASRRSHKQTIKAL